MKFQKVVTLVSKLPKDQQEAILELMEMQSEIDLTTCIQHFQKHEHIIDVKLEKLQLLINTKYNVLLGMMSFLGVVLTVVKIVGLKG